MNKISEESINLFKKYTSLDGVSGREHEIAAALKEDYLNLGCEILRDNLGSCFAIKRSKDSKFKVMLVAHMDEVGYMVSNIRSDGLINAVMIGGINSYNFTGARVTLTTKNKKFAGTCYNLNNEVKEAEDIVFDFGFTSLLDAQNNGVQIGDFITPSNDFKVLNDKNRLLAKAIDDRYGIVLGLDVLKSLKDAELPFDLYVGGSVQEEVGLRGGETSASLIKPDLAIVLDCSTALDYKGGLGKLDEGVLLRFFDRGMVAFPELLDLQSRACKKAQVKSQYFTTLGTTDAAIIHKSTPGGILTLTHCIVGRNIHTPSTVISSNDYVAAKESLVELLKMLTLEEFNKIKEVRGN